MSFFVNEVGCNTSQKSNGNVGGEKFIIDKNSRALTCTSYQDCLFTVLGFTNALGVPICCVIIIAAKQVNAKTIMGLQPWVDGIVGDPAVNIEEISKGPNKFYPYGPTCHVEGILIPSYVTCSDSGPLIAAYQLMR